jgi:chorismate-pyruvate lyase
VNPSEKASAVCGDTGDAALDLLYPLSEFYEESGQSLPAVQRLDPGAMPDPYRRLLVHERDMTPTLEAAYGESIHLRVLHHSIRDDVFSRQVLLVLNGGEPAVEFGAIKIHLGRFPEEARRLILERRKPLGAILHQERMEHTSRPIAYFQVTCDTAIGEALGIGAGQALYGRQNGIFDARGEVLAQVVEILPPLDPFAREKERG